MRALAPYLHETSFAFTTDIEWSPEWAIRDLFELADRRGVPLTPFLTHRSEYLSSRLRAGDDVGLHPNFLPGSTHGANVDEVVASAFALWPQAVSFRAHCFYDDTRMLRKIAARGIRYDSNLLAFLHPYLMPFRTVAGTLRFPVFWEDDVHGASGLPWDLAAIRDPLEAPGLKIVNVHPLFVAINAPSEAFYESKRPLYQAGEDAARANVHDGRGARTMLEDLFAYARRDGRRPIALRGLFEQAVERGIAVSER